MAASPPEAGLLHQEQAEAEDAYRHGYSQGYLAAYHDAFWMVRCGLSRGREVVSVLETHALNSVHPWRLAFDRDAPERVSPPKLDRSRPISPRAEG